MTTIMNNINKMFPNDNIKKTFLCQVVLEFGLSLDSLEELLGIDKANIYSYLESGNDVIERFVYRRLLNPAANQENARNRFKEFIRDLTLACLDKDIAKFKNILSIFSDSGIREFALKHESGMKISDDDILMLLKYQIKYQLNRERLVEMVGINYRNYYRRTKELLEEHPELKADYEALVNFTSNIEAARGRNG